MPRRRNMQVSPSFPEVAADLLPMDATGREARRQAASLRAASVQPRICLQKYFKNQRTRGLLNSSVRGHPFGRAPGWPREGKSLLLRGTSEAFVGLASLCSDCCSLLCLRPEPQKAEQARELDRLAREVTLTFREGSFASRILLRCLRNFRYSPSGDFKFLGRLSPN